MANEQAEETREDTRERRADGRERHKELIELIEFLEWREKVAQPPEGISSP